MNTKQGIRFVGIMILTCGVASCKKADISKETTTSTAFMRVTPQEKAKYLNQVLPPNARTVLERSRNLMLMSLDPDEEYEGKFHGQKVLGEVRIRRKATRTKLLKALYENIADAAPTRDGLSIGTTCDPEPRHGLRAMHNGDRVDVLICFECSDVEVFYNGRRTGGVIRGRGKKVFTAILKDSHVPLARN